MLGRALKSALALSVAVPAVTLGAGAAMASSGGQGRLASGGHGLGPGGTLRVTPVLSGQDLTHTFTPAGGPPVTAPLAGPDDLTKLGGDLFVAFQNGVGPQGQPATNGNTASTVVGFTPNGRVVGQWDLTGHVDGLTADRRAHRLLATVNEDANSSLYVIDPGTSSIQHYSYDENPLPHNGGTDAISIYRDRILISASAPGTSGAAAPQPQYPAVYSVTLDPQTSVASVSPLFSDEATALAANGPHPGQPVKLGLTDPDSNEVVPASSPRFGTDFVLDSQGDQEQVYISDPGGPTQQLRVLALDQAIDDTAWVTDPRGVLYVSDSSSDSVDAVTGRFDVGTAYVAASSDPSISSAATSARCRSAHPSSRAA
jgi:hypothetical protein